MKKFKVGIIGCGAISKNYIKYSKEVYYDYFEIVALGDIDIEKAKEKAERFEISRYGLPEIVYNADDIDLIINLTVPNAHEEVTIKCLECGKHVYTEKPLATSREGMRRIMEVVPLCPSARNRQALRLRPVTAEESEKVLPFIRLGGALTDIKLPLPGTEPHAFIVICSTAAEDKYVNMDIGIIAQTMLLQATEIGLNGICIGAFDHAAVQKSLDLPYEPLLILAIGKGAEKIVLVESSETESRNYYRKDGVHYVPKLSLDTLIIK